MSESILLVDDEPNVSKALERILLRNRKYRIYRAMSGLEGLDILAQHSIDVVISDQQMPGMTGSEFLAKVQIAYPTTTRILLSGHSDFQGVIDAINNGAIYKYWAKPLRSETLYHQLDEAVKENCRLKYSQQRNQIIATAVEGVITTDSKGQIISANPAIEIITGYQANELQGKNFFEVCLDCYENKILLLKSILQATENQGNWNGSLKGLHKDGSSIFMELSITGFRNHQGQVSHLGILLLDITEHKKLASHVEFLNYHDEVTGLPNKRLFRDCLTSALSASRQNNEQISLLSIDIDRFDNMTDNISGSAVEKVLEIVTKRLQAVVPETATIAHFGGSEFAILLSKIASRVTTERLVLAILAGFEKSLCIDGEDLYLRFNLGIVIAPIASSDTELLLQQASTAKQHAKELGQSYCIYAANMKIHLRERWLLGQALSKALEKNELSLVYQPKLIASTGQVQGMEALMRWHHFELGDISPEKFIPIAEETGLIVKLSEWCLHKACEQAKLWHAQGFDGLRLAVNLSACQMRVPNIYKMIDSTLASHNYPAHLLELEITESSLLHDEEIVLDLLQKFRRLGIHIAADDFGTGYCSIDYVKRFPFTTLKIDRSFISNITDYQKDSVILDSIFMLSKSLGMEVVAEGVETESQYKMLCEKGCDLIQGFLFSKPLSVDDFTEYLLQKSSKTRVVSCSAYVNG